jgi:WD40 repeat protein
MAKVWDAAGGKELFTLEGHSGGVMSASFSPDGRRIVTGSDDQTAKVWDAATGEELLTLKGHKEWVISAAFSPDGRRIATGSADLTAKIWGSRFGGTSRGLAKGRASD